MCLIKTAIDKAYEIGINKYYNGILKWLKFNNIKFKVG